MLIASCVPSEDVPAESQMRCQTDADCPGSWLCHPALKRCKEPGFEADTLPRPEVVYALPADGADGVEPSGPFIVVFSLEVDTESLQAHSFVRAEDTETPLVVTPIDGRTFELTPETPLAYGAAYTLALEAGIEGAGGLASESSFTRSFTTREAPDRTPPAAPTDILMDVRGPESVALSWMNPPADFAGVLVLRASGATVNAEPTPQTTYVSGDSLGNATVVGVTTGGQVLDAPGEGGPFAYAVIAYDAEHNYSSAAHAPFVSDVTLRWCPDESAHLSVTGPMDGTLRALVGLDPDNLDLERTTPTASVDLGEVLNIPSTHFTVGQTNRIRPVVDSGGATYVGAPIAQMAHPGTLEVVHQPTSVGPGGASSFVLAPGAWSSFEAQVDTDPAPGAESYTNDALLRSQPNVEAGAVMGKRGEFRFRVRPTASACGDAAWTVSTPFNVGDWVYVAANAPDGGDGNGPGTPRNDLAAVLDTAPSGTEIYVAEGDYHGTFTMEHNLRLLGGWSADFRERDPDTHIARLYDDGTSAPTLLVPSGAETTLDGVIDGFDIEKTGDGGVGPPVPFRIRETVTVRDVQVRAAWDAVGWSTNLLIDNGAAPVIDALDVIGPTAASNGSTAVICKGGADVVIRNSTIHAGTAASRHQAAVQVEGSTQLVLEHSTLSGGWTTNTADAHLRGVYGHNGSHVILRHNEIHGAAQPESVTPFQVRGVELWHTGELVGNRIYGGAATESSIGVRVWNSGVRVAMRNNIILGGYAPDSFGVTNGYRVTLIHNTIGATGPSGSPAVQSTTALSGCDGPCTVINNIFFTASGTDRWGVRGGSGTPLAIMRNNLFAAVPHGLFPPASTQDLAGLHALDGEAVNVPQGCTSDCDTADVRDNTAIADAFIGDVFEDWDGPDNDPQTWADNDFRLRTDEGGFIGSGLDASTLTSCGAPSLPLSCSPVTTDIDGNPRTCPTAGACYRPGAVEKD